MPELDRSHVEHMGVSSTFAAELERIDGNLSAMIAVLRRRRERDFQVRPRVANFPPITRIA